MSVSEQLFNMVMGGNANKENKPPPSAKPTAPSSIETEPSKEEPVVSKASTEQEMEALRAQIADLIKSKQKSDAATAAFMKEKVAKMAKMEIELQALRQEKELREAAQALQDEEEDVDLKKTETLKPGETLDAVIKSRDEAIQKVAEMEESNQKLKDTVDALKKEVAALKAKKMKRKQLVPPQKAFRSSTKKPPASPARMSRRAISNRSRATSSNRSKSCKPTNDRNASCGPSKVATKRSSSQSADPDRKSKTPSKGKRATGRVPDWDKIHQKEVFSHHVDLVDYVKNKNDRIANIFGCIDSVTNPSADDVADKVTNKEAETKVVGKAIPIEVAERRGTQSNAKQSQHNGPDTQIAAKRAAGTTLKRKRKFKEIGRGKDEHESKSEEIAAHQTKRAKICTLPAVSKSERVTTETKGNQGKGKSVRRGRRVFWECTNCGSKTHTFNAKQAPPKCKCGQRRSSKWRRTNEVKASFNF